LIAGIIPTSASIGVSSPVVGELRAGLRECVVAAIEMYFGGAGALPDIESLSGSSSFILVLVSDLEPAHDDDTPLPEK
jgi:hypothetical protein